MTWSMELRTDKPLVIIVLLMYFSPLLDNLMITVANELSELLPICDFFGFYTVTGVR